MLNVRLDRSRSAHKDDLEAAEGELSLEHYRHPFVCSYPRRFSPTLQRCARNFSISDLKNFKILAAARFYFFQQKNRPGGDGCVHVRLERLDRLSLPRRARRCAEDAVINRRLVLQSSGCRFCRS